LIGTHPGGPESGSTNPPNKYTFPPSAAMAGWWSGWGIGVRFVQAFAAGSYSYTTPADFQIGMRPPNT